MLYKEIVPKGSNYYT
jgi:hypothetical protein